MAERRWNAASRASLGPTLAGLNVPSLAAIVVIVVGTMAVMIVQHGRGIGETLLVVAVGSVLTGLAGTAAWVLLWPPDARRAFEAFAWLGEHDLDRVATIIAGKPTLPHIRRYVQTAPERVEDRWLRVEAHAALGNVEEARAIALRLPERTAVERVERASLVGYTSWLVGGDGDLPGLRAAVADLGPEDGDDRLRAEVVLAMAEVRVGVAGGDPDPAAPLRSVRDRIGKRADGVLLLAARRQVGGYLGLSLGAAVILTVLDRFLAS